MYEEEDGECGYAEDEDYGCDEEDDSSSKAFYCEICNINCLGAQQFKEHLDGKKHKKAEGLSAGSKLPTSSAAASQTFLCKMCNVRCAGLLSYRAHLKGSRHEKVMKLQQALGKCIPSDTAGPSFSGSGIGDSAKRNSSKPAHSSNSTAQEVEPVGEEFVEALVNEGQSTTPYYCKLCNCRCTDKSTMDSHIRGRAHRVQYKRKVCPSFDIDKAPPKNSRAAEEKSRKNLMKVRQQELWNMRAMYQGQLMPKKPDWIEWDFDSPKAMFGSFLVRKRDGKSESHLDRMVKSHYAKLMPTSEEQTAITRLVSQVESALENLSNRFVKEKERLGAFRTGFSAKNKRNLKGVVRIGSFGKSIMLRGERVAHLVVVCEEKPTGFFVQNIKDLLLHELQVNSHQKYEFKWDEEECLLKIATVEHEPHVMVAIAFTSFSMREENDSSCRDQVNPADVLDADKCLEALANLRHTRWFQGRCSDINCCTIMVRVMRDICRCATKWRSLNPWALELLIEKALTTAGVPLSAGEAFRRVFEAVASGIFLPDGLELLDPCEKMVIDAAWDMNPQEREDLTANAQTALRLIAFESFESIDDLIVRMNSCGVRKTK